MSVAALWPQSKARKRKAPTLRDIDWEPHKVRIAELYTSNATLKGIMAAIQAETGFRAECVLGSRQTCVGRLQASKGTTIQVPDFPMEA
jgi:hypothetical protein